jgi:sugar/nucleoside kinase (ribokinase family)
LHDIKDVVGIGNAIVDVLFSVDQSFLSRHSLLKGSMTLVDSAQASSIYSEAQKTIQMSGGSVGNTMAGIAALGGTASYIGKVSNDSLGELYREDLNALGIRFFVEPSLGSSPTACCLVMITPDGERTMATFLGACSELTPQDVVPELVINHQVTYLEGYLWDAPLAQESMVKAAGIAQISNRRVALTLSDSFCVDRHRGSFKNLIQNYVDILFSNEDELMSLYEQYEVESALRLARSICDLVIVTRGAKGCLISTGGETLKIDAVPVKKVIDTTGAGDLFAAGFLFGFTHGCEVGESAKIGSTMAAEVISQVGARLNDFPAELQNMVSPRRYNLGGHVV